MPTTLSIDGESLQQTVELSGGRTKIATVNKALREFITRGEQNLIIGLFGKLDWDYGYAYKNERVLTATTPNRDKRARRRSRNDA